MTRSMGPYYYTPWFRCLVYEKEIGTFEDDGCPNQWPELEEIKTPGVVQDETPNVVQGMWRIFSCSMCGWYVWHPIGYCHKCGGRMRKLVGKESDLQKHMDKNKFVDGGF